MVVITNIQNDKFDSSGYSKFVSTHGKHIVVSGEYH